MFRPLMAQPCMGGVGRGRLAERFRSLRQAVGDCVPPSPKVPLLANLPHAQFAGSYMGGSAGPASPGGDYMEQYTGMVMGGSSESASETNHRKPFCFYGWLPVAQLIFFVWSIFVSAEANFFDADVLSAFTHRSCVRYDRSRGRLPLL